MNFTKIRSAYAHFKNARLRDRLFSFTDISSLIDALPTEFEVSTLGHSVENRSIRSVQWGTGPTKILIWSQMHGNEATGTMAIFDLFGFLTSAAFKQEQLDLSKACTLFFIPMVNPDGAERWTRRNAHQIDINRDYLHARSPEAHLLKKAQQDIQPDFGFNLHDQNTLWSVNGQDLPAALSFLAPATDAALTVNKTRGRAMEIIAEMFKVVSPLLPDQIGLFDEEFEPRAFGDNFQINGTSTILIEAGGYKDDDEKQEIRAFYFLSLLAGVQSIANQTASENAIAQYRNIPANGKKLLHMIIHNVQVNGMVCSLSLNYDDQLDQGTRSIEKHWAVHDIGDLTGWKGYVTVENGILLIDTPVVVDDVAHFDVIAEGKTIYSFKNGILVHSDF